MPRGLGEPRRIRAAELQGDGMLERVKADQFFARSEYNGVGGHHFGVEPRAAREQAMEEPAMPVRPIHHRRHGKAPEVAGAFGVVLEKIPSELAAKVTKSLKIPTIGIGAGLHCDGQILVVSDMLGLYEDFHPRFVRYYAHLAETIRQSVGGYVKDVKEEKFPTQKESY